MQTITKHVYAGNKDSDDAIDLVTKLFYEHRTVIVDREIKIEKLEKRIQELESELEESTDTINELKADLREV